MCKVTRRRFLRLCGKIIMALGVGSLYPSFSRVTAMPPPIGEHKPREYASSLTVRHLRQLITAEAASSRTIMWEMDRLPDYVGVEYRAKHNPTAKWRESSYSHISLGDVGEPERELYIFAAGLTGLKPGGAYEYRIIAEDDATPWHSFNTPAGDDFKAIIVTDSQCGTDYKDWQHTVEQAIKQQPTAEFIADLGDIVDNGRSFWHWQEWYKGCDDILAQKIFVPVMGNHECYDLKWQMCLPQGYLAQFAQPSNGSRDFPGYYYAFRYGAAYFFVLNTQMLELDDLKPGLLAEEISWFRREALNAATPWKIVLMHKDILDYGEMGHLGLNDIGRNFMPLFEELKIDLVLTGHQHTYRNRGHILGEQHADRGPYYVLCGLSGNARYDVPDEALDIKKAPRPETDNYLTLAVSTEKLELQCYLPTGELIDEVLLTK